MLYLAMYKQEISETATKAEHISDDVCSKDQRHGEDELPEKIALPDCVISTSLCAMEWSVSFKKIIISKHNLNLL